MPNTNAVFQRNLIVRPLASRPFKKLALALSLACACNVAWAEPAKITEANAEFVYKLLLGEIAGQRGEYALSSQLLLDIAKQTQNVKLAERATQIALFGKQAGLALQASSLWSTLDSNSPIAAQTASQLWIAKGDLDKATPYIKNVLANKDVSARAFLELNSLLIRVEDKDLVLRTVQSLAQPYSAMPEAHFAIAQAAFFAKQSNLTDTELATASKLKPDWQPPILMKGQILLQSSADKGIDYFKEFLKKHPNADEVRLSLAKTLLAEKRLSEAKVQFTKLANDHKDNADMNAIVGLLALDAKDYSLAERSMQQALQNNYKDPEQLYIYLGRSASEQKRDAQALSWYEKVIGGEHFLQARFASADIIARTQGADKAIAMLDEVDGLTPEQQALVIQTEASLLNQAKRYDEAYALLDKATSSFPDNVELLYDHALGAERLGKLDIMERELYRIIKLKPDFAAAYNALGYSFADRNIKLTEAKTLIETGLSLSPKDHYIMDSLGWVFYRLGDLNRAEEQLRNAYAIQNDPEIAAHLGEVLWKLGKLDEAKAIWKKALAEAPNNETLVKTTQQYLQI